MRVYIAPRSVVEDPVRVTRIEIPQESQEFVSTALKRAYMSAVAMEAYDRRAAWSTPDENKPADVERGYRHKAHVYGAVSAEVGSLEVCPEPLTFDENDIFPAKMIHEGVLFGVGMEAQRSGNVEEVLARAMSHITYIEEPLG